MSRLYIANQTSNYECTNFAMFRICSYWVHIYIYIWDSSVLCLANFAKRCATTMFDDSHGAGFGICLRQSTITINRHSSCDIWIYTYENLYPLQVYVYTVLQHIVGEQRCIYLWHICSTTTIYHILTILSRHKLLHYEPICRFVGNSTFIYIHTNICVSIINWILVNLIVFDLI